MFIPHNCTFSTYIIGFSSEFIRSNFIIESSIRDFQISFGNRNSCLPGSRRAQAWQEPTLFRLALAAEKEIKRKRPQVYYDLLPE